PVSDRSQALHSFPTRRSSDLFGRRPEDGSPEVALEDRHGVPELRAVPAHERNPQPDARAGEGARAQPGGGDAERLEAPRTRGPRDRKSTRLNSSHVKISYAVF